MNHGVDASGFRDLNSDCPQREVLRQLMCIQPGVSTAAPSCVKIRP
jgi:hypothetical protein